MQMPDVNKKMESALIPVELAARLRRASIVKGIAKSDIMQLALIHELANVQLEPEDYLWMANEVKSNKMRRANSAAQTLARINAKLSPEVAAKRAALGSRLTDEQKMEALRRVAELGSNKIEPEKESQS